MFIFYDFGFFIWDLGFYECWILSGEYKIGFCLEELGNGGYGVGVCVVWWGD